MTTQILSNTTVIEQPAYSSYLETGRAMAPGQVTEPHVRGVSTLTYRQFSIKEIRAMQTPGEKRSVAYHEAGHAAMMFMFRPHYNIVSVDMRGTLTTEGTITARELSGIPIIGDLRDFPSDLRSSYTLLGKWSMMVDLAGYAAEHRVYPSDYGDWLTEQLDMNGDEWYENDPHDTHDMACAVRMAKTVRGDNKNAWKLLRQMAAWTDEVFSHAKVWAVVVALAEQLVGIKTRMCGKRVREIMDNAWNEAGMPCLKIGPKWRRRFSVRSSQAHIDRVIAA
jgi:hypothetical protein